VMWNIITKIIYFCQMFYLARVSHKNRNETKKIAVWQDFATSETRSVILLRENRTQE